VAARPWIVGWRVQAGDAFRLRQEQGRAQALALRQRRHRLEGHMLPGQVDGRPAVASIIVEPHDLRRLLRHVDAPWSDCLPRPGS
jgi:hypothetical protein